eukprot:TRINITY_DN2334_c0_g1_i1.p1 TRINITY_DN2334_c0_g1~~TRINITY_DN2334_c0_g1_i1.p1  ORF type:complete len:1838 (+),score=410.55 TRINITY_DN2334_c0_g1_i1:67-5580(+)
MSNPDPVEETKNLPLGQRLEHTHWKVRMVAYEELAKKFAEAEDANAHMFAEYSGILKKIVLDKNAVSLEKGLGALISFYDRYEQAARYTSQLAGVLVEKCLGARPKTKEDATQVLMLMIEVDKESEPVVSALIEGTKSKVPKIASSSVQVIEQAIKTFGVKAVAVKEILKEFGNWFEHTNAEVRAAASSCTVELRRWLGGILDKPVSNLREAQQKELAKLFEEMPKEPAAPLKYRRFEVDAMMAAAAANTGGGIAAAPKEIDAYELAEAVNVLSKCTPQFYTDLQSKKWKERKEALEAVVAIADNPKLESGDYGELIRSLKKCFSDANVFVVELAIRLIGLLGRGLRKEFAQLGKSCVGGMLEKFKEKKQNVVNAIHEALERMHPHCFTLLDITEDLDGAADSKVPSVKAETLSFVIKCLKVSNKANISKNVKPFCGMFMKLMGDGDPSVREKSFEAFGVLIGLVGERTLQGYIAKLEPIQDKRVREFIPSGPIGVAGPAVVAPPPPAAVDAADLAAIAADVAGGPKKPAGKVTGAAKKVAPPAATAVAEQPPAAAAKKVGKAGGAAKSSPAKKPKDDDDAPATTSAFPLDKDGRADITGRLGSGLLVRLDDADWKKRHEALIQVEQTLVDANRKIQMKGVFELVNALKKRLSDSNKNLVIVTLNLFGDLASACGPAINEMMKLIIHPIFTCFTDSKANVRDAVAVCLDKWVAEVTIDAFFPYLHNAIALPSGKKEILKWISTYLPSASKKADFKILIKDILTCLEDKTKEVRVQAEPIVAEVARRVGLKPIEAEISKLKPASAGPIRQLLSTITAAAPVPATSSAAGPKASRGSVGAASKNRFGAPVSAPGTPTKNMPEEETAPVAESAPVSVPQNGPVRRNDGKQQREQQNIPWSFDEPPKQAVEALKAQATECFSPELVQKMFDSNEAKDHASALSELEEALEPHKEGVLDSLDVILKWASLRLFDTNLAVLRKAVSLFSQLLGLLEIWQVHLSDSEAQSFILVFVERMGAVTHEAVLASMRSLLKQFNKLYPASKIFKMIMHETLQAQSKLSAQSRSECLKYLGLLIHQQSLSVCTPSEALPIIAHWIGDSSSDVAEAALETLAEAQRFLDPKDTLWRMLPDLSESHKALLEKKIENPTQAVVASSRAPIPTPRPATNSLPVPHLSDAKPMEKTPILVGSAQKRLLESLPKNLFKLELESLRYSVPPETEIGIPAKTHLLPYLAADASISAARTDPVAESLLQKTPGRMVMAWIRDISSADGAKAIDCMKVLAVQFKEGSSDDLNFLPNVDSLVLAISNRLLSQFPLPADPSEALRQLKYLLNTIMLILGKKALAKVLSVSTLKRMLQALLQPMIEDILNTKEEGKQLLKVFNVAVLKALDHCERTHAFVSLLQLMRELISPLDKFAPVEAKQPYSKMAELVLKCLLKLVKVLNATISELSLDVILREIHLFFVMHPPSSWKRRVDEVPLETAKTVLDRLVKLKGHEICKCLSLIPAATTLPQPIIYSQIHQLLRGHFPELVSDEAAVERHLSEDVATAYGELLGAPLHQSTPLPTSEAPLLPHLSFASDQKLQPQIFVPRPASSPQINEALEVIRRRLQSSETFAQAIVDLACLRRDHESAIDLPTFLMAFSPQFASFVQKSLFKIEKTQIATENVIPANMAPAALVDGYSKRIGSLRQRFGLQESGEGYYPTTTLRSLSNLNFQVPSISHPVSQPTSSLNVASSATVRPVSEKSSITALRERLKAAASSDSSASEGSPQSIPVSVPVTLPAPAPAPAPTPVLAPATVLADALLEVGAPASTAQTQPPPAAQSTTSSLAALRERLARIKGSQ